MKGINFEHQKYKIKQLKEKVKIYLIYTAIYFLQVAQKL